MKRFRNDDSLDNEHDDDFEPMDYFSDDELIVEDEEIDPDATGLKDVPCGVLLKILDFTDEFDFYNFSLVSKAIRHCLTTGRYTAAEKEGVRNRLREKMQVLGQKLRKNPRRIADMTDPSEFFQLIAVRANPSTIRLIKNPSDKVKWAAFDKDAKTIIYIDQPFKFMRRMNEEQLLSILIDSELPLRIREKAGQMYEKISDPIWIIEKSGKK